MKPSAPQGFGLRVVEVGPKDYEAWITGFFDDETGFLQTPPAIESSAPDDSTLEPLLPPH